uniref:C2H2-type domain-containing protein n=1 Tax=Lutzomyia longipalpis TaxID=7200 RepID=A0A1B0CV34_LUTLO
MTKQGIFNKLNPFIRLTKVRSRNLLQDGGPLVMFMDDGLPRYVCPQCGVKYKKFSALKAHRKECGRGAQCPLCPKIVTQKRNLPKHMERHAKDGLLDQYLQSAYADDTNFE